MLDDNKQVCDSLRALIESLNIECETFSTEAALTERISNSKCGLLVIDVQLQDSNGTEVLQRLRKTGCSTHAILMSGHSFDLDESTVEPVTQMLKPFDIKDFIQLIENLY